MSSLAPKAIRKTGNTTVPAPQNPGGPAAIAEQFEYAQAFMVRTGLPVYMGEFGAADKGARESAHFTFGGRVGSPSACRIPFTMLASLSTAATRVEDLPPARLAK
jgi:hypothetical protein